MSNFDSNQRTKIWTKYYGTRYAVNDVFGKPMNRDNFEADHIYPQSKGGRTMVENGIPLSSFSNSKKADDFRGNVNGNTFEVKHYADRPKFVGSLYVNGIKVSKI